MGLWKRHAKKRNPRVHDSKLFGIIDKAEFANQMRNGEASFSTALNFSARKQVRNAVLEAEYRKGQAITLTRQMYYT